MNGTKENHLYLPHTKTEEGRTVENASLFSMLW